MVTQHFEAEEFDLAFGVGVFTQGATTKVGNTQNGDWVAYEGIDFGSASGALHVLTARVSSGTQGGVLEFRLGSPDGELIADKNVFNTGGFASYFDVSVELGAISGIHDLHVVFRGSATSIADLDRFSIESGIVADPAVQRFEAEDYDATSGVGVFRQGMGWKIGDTQDGDWVRYDTVSFGADPLAEHSLTLTVAAGTQGGTVQIRSGGPDGELLAIAEIENTGGWTSFRDITVDLGRLSGEHDLYFVFDGNASSIGDVDRFRIETTTPNPIVLEVEHVDGVDVIAHDPAMALSAGALSFTFQADSVVRREGLVSKDASFFGDGGHLTAWWQNGTVVLRVQDRDTSYFLHSRELALGEAHDVTIGFGDDGVRLYVDGELHAYESGWTGGLATNLEPLVIGASQWASGQGAADDVVEPFHGLIGDVALRAGVLPPEDVAFLSGLPPLDFARAGDRTLILEHGPVDIDGVSDAVILPHDEALALETGTLMLTVTSESGAGRQGIFTKDAVHFGDGGHFSVFLVDGVVEVRLQTTDAETVLRGGELTVGTQHEIAVTFGPTGLRLYVDGEMIAEDRDTTAGLLGNEEPVVIGANQWRSSAGTADDLTGAFTGSIDAVRLYDTALSPEALSDPSVFAGDTMPAPGEIRLPAGSGAVRVEDFGAVANDGIDDTAAIRAAFEYAEDNGFEQTFVVFGAGVYDISDTIGPARSRLPSGEREGFISKTSVQGAGEGLTELRFAEGLGFTGAVVDFGNANRSADAFHNNLRDLTITLGAGNAQATGLVWSSSNTGTVANVTIRSEDGTGRYGIDLAQIVNNGPHLIRDVTVDGFDTGIFLSSGTGSHVFEDITLANQSVVGIHNLNSQVITARGVEFLNAPRAVLNGFNQDGDLVLLDSRIEASDNPTTDANGRSSAILNSGSTFLRDVAISDGFDLSYHFNRNSFVHNQIVERQADGRIDEFWQVGAHGRDGTGIQNVGGAYTLFEGTPETSLGLEVREHPDTPLPQNLSDWVSIAARGATAGITGNPLGDLSADDDTLAIQAAIDAAAAAGASTVYIPEGVFVLNGDVTLHGSVTTLIGLGGEIWGNGRIIIGEGDGDVVHIQGLRGRLTNQPQAQIEVSHASDRALAVQDTSGWRYTAETDPVTGETLAGDLYLRNVVTSRLVVEEGQNVWARQLNIEGDFDSFDHPSFADAPFEAKIVNNGGTLWVLGFKTEQEGTHVITRDGGRTEIFGAWHQSGQLTGPDGALVPQYVTIDSDFSIAVLKNGFQSNPNFGSVLEIRDGVAVEGQIVGDLYSAIRPETLAPHRVMVDNDDLGFTVENVVDGIVVPIETLTPFQGGIIGDDIVFADTDSGVRFIYEADLDPGLWEVSIRFNRTNGGQPDREHATNAPVEIVHENGTTVLSLDQTRNFNDWHSLGVFGFGTDLARVTIGTEGAGGEHVVADAILFTRIVGLGETSPATDVGMI
ncbi:carbohydrate-binding protein [Salinarimonas ramus]|uniref:CBM6 domain-containing protein n=1 Tax=Salinarimonas ramus TaxID=690164 RepID=A0A917Q4L1_9HYPH|nr:carbohydrate-binding protein [Salinarimonas ramus]GGK22146.1 hypothetical protein GCM10011322_05980 [Salinarimonas ramus]